MISNEGSEEFRNKKLRSSLIFTPKTNAPEKGMHFLEL